MATKLSSAKLLLFDLDGTLVDSQELMRQKYNILARRRGFKFLSEADITILRDLSARDILKYLGVPFYAIPWFAKEMRKLVKKEMVELPLFPNWLSVLGRLVAEGYTLHIVTTNSEETVREFLREKQMPFFKDVHSVSRLGGKTKLFNKIRRANNLQKNEIIYIGDEVRDVEEARDAGIISVAVVWGYNSAKALQSARPDFLINQPEELIHVLDIEKAE